MNKKLKIYLKTGIGFLVLFIASVVAITLLQAENNREDMERTLTATTELGREIIQNVECYNENDYTTGQLMYTINSRMNSFVSGAWSNHKIYASVLLLDSNRQIMSRSGYMLYNPSQNVCIHLEKFCSQEQLNLLYYTFRSEFRGNVIALNRAEIFGFLDNLEQWIPQRLELYGREDESISLILEFDIPTDSGQPASCSFDNNSMLWIPGPGTQGRASTKTDKKILKECDELSIRNIENAQENQLGAGGMSKAYYMTFDGVGTITIDNETYYFAIGGQGFPLRAAISELMPLYIFLLFVMLILFFIVSRGFFKQYQRQLALEADRRKLTAKATDTLKVPLDMIRDCGAELRQSVSDDKRAELLDAIINKTEQMDDTVQKLLISAQTGEKDEKK